MDTGNAVLSVAIIGCLLAGVSGFCFALGVWVFNEFRPVFRNTCDRLTDHLEIKYLPAEAQGTARPRYEPDPRD